MEKNKCKVKMIIKNAKGITLLALAVTIVVLLILTSIGIKLALGDNGIIGEAKTAKESAEIDEEKGIVKRATTVSLIKSKGSKVEQATLEKALNDEAGEDKTEVSDVGDVFEVLFTDSNRYYEVDQDGNISEPQEVVKDEYAGDITKGGRCDGSKEKPYEISCIEDLVAFSNMSNGYGIKFENGKAVEITNWEAFTNKNIILTKNLNFKSKFSYADSTRTDFGDINGDDLDGNSLMTEMTTGTGFRAIGCKINNFMRVFYGTFDGNDMKIENIFENIEDENSYGGGLFCNIGNGTIIENLTVSGKICSQWNTGGIVGNINNGSTVTIKNCTNKANIVGKNSVGGIVGFSGAGDTTSDVTIKNCNNYGTITITGGGYAYTGAGGISGAGGKNILNCNNYGNITGVYPMGGIVGYIAVENGEIINCINKGNVDNETIAKTSGGIVGVNSRSLKIINCSNNGNVTGLGDKGGIIGTSTGSNWSDEITLSIENCTNIGLIKSSTNRAGGIIGSQGTTAAKNYLYVKHSLNIGEIEGKISNGDILGVIITSTSTETKTEFSNVYCTDTAIGSGTLTSGEATHKTIAEMKSQSFVDLLNSYQDDTGVYPSDWKKWKLEKDGYPTLEE